MEARLDMVLRTQYLHLVEVHDVGDIHVEDRGDLLIGQKVDIMQVSTGINGLCL